MHNHYRFKQLAVSPYYYSYPLFSDRWQNHSTWCVRARLKRDGTSAETRFVLSEKWTSPFKSAGDSVQSTAGSRGVQISGRTMDRPCSEALCKSSGYPLQSPISPSLPLLSLTVCHHVSNGLYHPVTTDRSQ